MDVEWRSVWEDDVDDHTELAALLARLHEQAGTVRHERPLRLDETALAAEADPRFECGQGRSDALDRVASDRQVVLDNRGVTARAALEQHPERLLHLVYSVGLAEVGAGHAAVADGASWNRKGEFFRERERAIGGLDRGRVRAAQPFGGGQLCVGRHQSRPARLLLEQVDRLGGGVDSEAVREPERGT